MTVYPGAIDQFRVHNNLPGMNYDAEKADIIYAEDINKISENIVAIETALGINPQGASADIAARLGAIDTLISGKQNSLGFTPEDISNKSTTTTLGNSDTLYPTQKAVKTYVDLAVIDKFEITGIYHNFYQQGNQTGTTGNSYTYTAPLPRTIATGEDCFLIPTSASWAICSLLSRTTTTFNFKLDCPVSTAGMSSKWSAIYYKAH